MMAKSRQLRFQFLSWLFKRPNNMQMYLRDGSAQTIVRAATLREKLLFKLACSPHHSIQYTQECPGPLEHQVCSGWRDSTGTGGERSLHLPLCKWQPPVPWTCSNTYSNTSSPGVFSGYSGFLPPSSV